MKKKIYGEYKPMPHSLRETDIEGTVELILNPISILYENVLLWLRNYRDKLVCSLNQFVTDSVNRLQ